MTTFTPLYNLPIAGSGDPADAPSNESGMMGAVESAIKQSFILKVTDTIGAASSTTRVSDPELSLTLTTSATYRFELDLIYGALTGVGINLGFAFPAGTTMNWQAAGLASGVVISSGIIQMQNLLQTDNISLGSAAAVATNVHANLRGTIKTSATAGALVLQWAQAVSSATQTVVRAGSFYTVKRIG